ncbi:major capsid protein [Capybara microvirus Cap3_SP_446]|nr:major capsid protein [Capybara microvirus Cap3_SP_446]
MAKELLPFDTGSNYNFADKFKKAEFARSMFDLSHTLTTTVDNCGYLVPILTMPVLPGDSIEISLDNLIRVMPQVVPLMSRQRAYCHMFYARESDLWEDALEYQKRGYSGNTVLQKPVLNAGLLGSYWSKAVAAGDLLNYLGLPIGYSPEQLSAISPISALPLFMYFKIVWQYYRNKNLMIDDRVRLPNKPQDFRLASDGTIISNKYADSENPAITLGELLCREWQADYFTSAFPSPQRGNAATLPATANLSGADFDAFLSGTRDVGEAYKRLNFQAASGITAIDNFNIAFAKDASGSSKHTAYGSFASSLINNIAYLTGVSGRLNLTNGTSSVDLDISLNDIRQLAIKQLELERMAKTDGSDYEFGMTFFGVASRNAVDFHITYCGGCYQGLAFSEVLQTSASTDDSALGRFAGHGISAQKTGYCGKLDADEHGICMVLFSVMPDVYYSQGLDKFWTITLEAEEFKPGRDRMGMTAILNRELYISGDSSKDNLPYAYQDPFDYLRYMPNRISGKIADSASLSFSPYTQGRLFASTPTYSHSFFDAKSVRKDYLYAPSEVAYIVETAFEIRAVRELSYVQQPAQILN